jgi:hypothetical protein
MDFNGRGEEGLELEDVGENLVGGVRVGENLSA